MSSFLRLCCPPLDLWVSAIYLLYPLLPTSPTDFQSQGLSSHVIPTSGFSQTASHGRTFPCPFRVSGEVWVSYTLLTLENQMALFFILCLPDYNLLTLLLLWRNPDFHSMRHFHPKVKARFKKQAFCTMEFLKKVAIPYASMRGQGGPQGHPYSYLAALPLFFLPPLNLSLASFTLPHHRLPTSPEGCSPSF